MYQRTASTSILRLRDNALIPADPANSDYAEYQRWLAAGNTVQALPVPPLTAVVASALRRIDRDVDQIIADTIGQRAEEYRLAESQAQAFRTALYTGTVPPFVADWAAVKGWTAQQAADDTLAIAAAWRAAQASIRQNRLKHKDDIRRATTHAAVETLLTSWSTFVAQIRSSLGLT